MSPDNHVYSHIKDRQSVGSQRDPRLLRGPNERMNETLVLCPRQTGQVLSEARVSA